MFSHLVQSQAGVVVMAAAYLEQEHSFPCGPA